MIARAVERRPVVRGVPAAVAAGWAVVGLGATTNLTDQVPWVLWKILNVVAELRSRRALSASAFSSTFPARELRPS